MNTDEYNDIMTVTTKYKTNKTKEHHQKTAKYRKVRSKPTPKTERQNTKYKTKKNSKRTQTTTPKRYNNRSKCNQGRNSPNQTTHIWEYLKLLKNK